MWRNEDHIFLCLYLKEEIAGRLRSISESLCEAFPGLFVAPPDTYGFPIAIYQFPFPIPVQGENYPDTLEKYLDRFNICDFWYPGNIRFHFHSLLISDHALQLCLCPAYASDQSRMSQITQELKEHYGWEPCTPVITFAQLNPDQFFPAAALEALEGILEKLDFEMTAELHGLALEVLYDDEPSDQGG